jgi:hypothetical protein
MKEKTPKIILVIFCVAMLLRFCLALANRDANDNHIDVVSWIVDKKEIPERKDCWSCYQPKLYYVISAGVVKLFNITSSSRRILSIQFVNVFISFFIILIFWKYINKQNFSVQTKYILFGLFALNPCLTGINCQGTNDTLAIFSGIATVFFLDEYLRTLSLKSFSLTVIFIIASCLTKASGLLLTTLFIIIFSVRLISERNQRTVKKLIKHFLMFLVFYLLIVPYLGGYYTNYKKYNSFALSTWEKDTPPHFITPSYVARPGVQDMVHGFLTFRYFDMVRQPYINNEADNYPLHRTSLWSQLYGRTFFMHFDQWPGSWQTHNDFIIFVGRILIVLGIIPLLLFILGIIYTAYLIYKAVIQKGLFPSDSIHLLITFCFLCASVKYCCDYRDFGAMKSIYIFPALLSYLKLTGIGLDKMVLFKSLNKIIIYVLSAIVCLSAIDIIYLIIQLIKFYHYF